MAVKIDIVSGFLGAGKTTLINKLLAEVTRSDTVAVVENEFGEINIDGKLLSKTGVTVREISAGCICCSLFGDFVAAMGELLTQYPLTRVIVEPTGIGRLSDVIKACGDVRKSHEADVNMQVTVVDCLNYEMHQKMFGDFFSDQVQYAHTIFLSRTQLSDAETVDRVVRHLKSVNDHATIITTDWSMLSGAEIVRIGERKGTATDRVTGDPFQFASRGEAGFKAWNKSTDRIYAPAVIKGMLEALGDQQRFGTVVRGKGLLQSEKGSALRFDYVPGQVAVETIDYAGEGKIVIIGQDLKTSELEALFNLES